MFTLKIIIEVLVVLLLAGGVYHEESLVEFEEVFIFWARNGFKIYRGGKN